jgi:predicted outer membrane protein
MSKSFTSAVLVCSAIVCGGQALGQNATPPEDRADRKVTGAANESPNNRQPAADQANPVTQANQNQANVPGQANQARREQVQQGQMNRHAGYTQHDLATCLTIAIEGEVAVSKIGAEKAQHADVKKFAEEMVKAHTDMIAKLQQADAANIAAVDGRQATGAGANNSAAPDSNAGRRAASVEPSSIPDSPFISLKRELAAQCLQSKQEELGQKSGAEFDKCFMGAQLGMHMEAIDTMKVFSKHTSGELKSTIEEGIKTAQSHLEHAKSIKKTLETAAK